MNGSAAQAGQSNTNPSPCRCHHPPLPTVAESNGHVNSSNSAPPSPPQTLPADAEDASILVMGPDHPHNPEDCLLPLPKTTLSHAQLYPPIFTDQLTLDQPPFQDFDLFMLGTEFVAFPADSWSLGTDLLPTGVPRSDKAEQGSVTIANSDQASSPAINPGLSPFTSASLDLLSSTPGSFHDILSTPSPLADSVQEPALARGSNGLPPHRRLENDTFAVYSTPVSLMPAQADGTVPGGLSMIESSAVPYSMAAPPPNLATSGLSQGTGVLQTMHGEPSRCLKRRRPTAEEREGLKQMRRTGACVRCRIYRMKCDGGVICAPCEKSMTGAKLFTQPCIRLQIKDILPFRAGNGRLGQVRSTLPKFRWSMDNPELRKISVSPLFLDGTNPTEDDLPCLTVKCRRFIPGPNDVLAETYEAPDGSTTTIEFPPYACLDADTTRAQSAMDTYLDACQPLAEASIDASTTDEIIKSSLKEARRYARSRSTIVSAALKIQAASCVSGIQPFISSPETLGISPLDDPRFKQHGRALIPIALDYQLDNLYIAYMQRHLKHALDGLKKLVYSRTDNREKWYEIYLGTLVMLCTLESVSRHQVEFVRKYAGDGGNIFASANFSKRNMMDEWHSSAKNLLYHFRVIVRGMVPFRCVWSPEMQEKAGLDDESVAYIQNVASMVAERRAELHDLGNEDKWLEDPQPLLWIGQLFLED